MIRPLADRISCKLCRHPSTFVGATPNEHSRTRTLHHYRCRRCGTVFVGDPIEPEELGVAYGSLDSATYYRETEFESAAKLKASVRDLERAGLVKSSRLIDIGTGNGRLISLLHDAGYSRLSCHEIPGAPLDGLRTLGCAVYEDFDFASVPSGAFDVVTMLDVVEHVLDPHSLFAACRRMLRDGGLAYFHTPVVTAVDRMMHVLQAMPGFRKVGRMWQRGRTSIFHLQNFTPRSLLELLSRHGFEPLTFTVRNELSWPLQRYIRVYLCEKQGLPGFLSGPLTPILYPLLATDVMNSNKAIVLARRRPGRE